MSDVISFNAKIVNHKIPQSQNPTFLCIEYIIFDACGLFVKKNFASFLAA